MNANPVMLAIPFFFLAIGIEILIDRFRQSKLYQINDTVTNLTAGTTQQVVGVFFKVATLGLYEWVYHNFAIFRVPQNWWTFIILFLAYDFCYYWAHRMSHEINLLWSGHVVHHQSEEYNLSVALRQSWFQGIWTAPFYLPLALIGFNTTQLLFVGGINLIYQFWIHTELINKMGFLEYFMNTPSHHRVHHGRNPKYIDKNHAGVFIIWDRLFGTFQKEEESPVYGITTPINSWNPVWANFSHYENIGKELKSSKGVFDKLRILFYKPGWSAKMAAYYPIPEVKKENYTKFDTTAIKSANGYVLFQYILLLIATFPFLLFQGEINMISKFITASLICLSVMNFGCFFEGKKRAYQLEFARLFASAGTIVWLLLSNEKIILFSVCVGIALAASLIWLVLVRREFKPE